MWLLWSLLPVLGWRQAASTSVDTESLVQSSPRAFYFEDLPPGNGALSSAADLKAVPGVSACECRARCLSNHTCRGYGTSDASQTCLLTGLLPTPQRMTASSEEWRWHARTGVRLLDEPCETDADCSLLVPGAVCLKNNEFNSKSARKQEQRQEEEEKEKEEEQQQQQQQVRQKNVCQCRAGLERDDVGGCRKAGSFIEVTRRQLTSGLLSVTPQTSVEACRTACAGSLSCVAVDFSAAAGLCRMYAKGVTNEVTSSGDVQSFVWSFARADGTPPDTFQQVGNSFLRLLPPDNCLESAQACFHDGAILFPEVTEEGLSPLKDYITKQDTTPYIWIGLQDMLEEGRYVTSDGREMNMTEINWD